MPEDEENIEKLKEKLQECEKLKNEYLAGWQRARADLINYKKEELERVGEMIKYANLGLILKILPILDNFEIAIKNLPEDLKENENVKGLLQIERQLKDFLKSHQVQEIKIEIGQEKFDPNFHEVVEEIETDNKETGTILEEVQKGFKFQNQVLRPAKVKVAK